MSAENTKVEYSSAKAYTSFGECFATDGKDHIFLMGGTRMNPRWTSGYFQIYEVSTNSWKKGPSMNWEIADVSCIVSSVTKRIYTFGGNTKPQVIQSINLDFESTGENWKVEDATLSSPGRMGAKSSEVGNGDIYIIGGLSSGPSDAVDIFMPSTGEIFEGPSLRTARFWHAQMSVFSLNCFARTTFVYTPTCT